MTVASMCRSLQAPAMISRPERVVRSSCSSSSYNGRLQQPAHVVSLPGNLSQLVTNSRIDSASILGSGTVGLAGSVRWRSSGTSTTTCVPPGSPGLGADERSSLVVEHDFAQAHHVGKAGASASAAACPYAAPSTEDIAAAAPRPAPSSTPDVKLMEKVRAIFFYVTTYSLIAVTCMVQMMMHPFVLAFDKQQRIAHHITTKTWAALSTLLFFETEVEGRENLPAAEEGGVVFVSNHQSSLDTYPLHQLGRPFRFVSKSSTFRVPFLGGVMRMNGHVPLLRMDPKSTLMCLKECMNLVKEGVSVLFFPEGTVAPEGTLTAFKKGAFKVAAREGVPVVPIAIIGTGRLQPKGFEYILRSGKVKVVIHPPIRSKSADELCNQSRKIIAEAMLKHGLPADGPVST